MITAKEYGWNLCADLSAPALPRLLYPKRYKSARKIAEEKGIHDRLLLRSDFSVVVGSVIPELSDGLDLEEPSDLLGTSNPLDRNVKWLRRLGSSQAVFERGAQLLGLST
jgi:hypothetical protein